MSFDVVSLYTEVPTDLAVRVALDRLQDDPSFSQRMALSLVEVTRLLTFCLDATDLSYYREVATVKSLEQPWGHMGCIYQTCLCQG